MPAALVLPSTEQRVVAWLKEIAPGGGGIPLRRLAGALGMTPQAIADCLRRLHRLGALVATISHGITTHVRIRWERLSRIGWNWCYRNTVKSLDPHTPTQREYIKTTEPSQRLHSPNRRSTSTKDGSGSRIDASPPGHDPQLPANCDTATLLNILGVMPATCERILKANVEPDTIRTAWTTARNDPEARSPVKLMAYRLLKSIGIPTRRKLSASSASNNEVAQKIAALREQAFRVQRAGSGT